MKIRMTVASLSLIAAATTAFSHGDVAPQPLDTSTLPDIGEEWLTENPYRDAEGEAWAEAVKVGSSGYNSNCARCHGLEVVSGGLAPDLRYLEAEEYGDEWFVERFRHGMTQNGITKMPAFDEVLDQKAAWAIRTYIETRPDDGALDDHQVRLKEIRDELVKLAEAGEGLDAADALKAEMSEIAGTIETASGAPVADSIASRAVFALENHENGLAEGAEILTIGLSAAE